jgi:hypothetical protein
MAKTEFKFERLKFPLAERFQQIRGILAGENQVIFKSLLRPTLKTL